MHGAANPLLETLPNTSDMSERFPDIQLHKYVHGANGRIVAARFRNLLRTVRAPDFLGQSMSRLRSRLFVPRAYCAHLHVPASVETYFPSRLCGPMTSWIPDMVGIVDTGCMLGRVPLDLPVYARLQSPLFVQPLPFLSRETAPCR